MQILGAELDPISAALTDTIHEHLEELDDDMRSWTLQSTRANLGVIVAMMRAGDDPTAAEPPPEAVGYAKEYVVRGLDLFLLQRAYRTAQGIFAEIILARLRAATDDLDRLTGAMTFFNSWVFAWMEAIERRLTDIYMGEREQWVRGAAAVRAAEVRALLSGKAADPDAVSVRLGYELGRHHVGYVVWSEEAGERPGDAGALFAAMERAAAQIAESLGAGAPLTVAEGRHLACWAGLREPPDLKRLRMPKSAAGKLSVAAGTPAHGVEGFVLTHREALVARRVAQLRGDGDRGARRLSRPGPGGAPGRRPDHRPPLRRPRARPARRPRRRHRPHRLHPGDLPRGGRQLRRRRPPPRRPLEHRRLPRPPRRSRARPPGHRAPTRAPSSPPPLPPPRLTRRRCT